MVARRVSRIPSHIPNEWIKILPPPLSMVKKCVLQNTSKSRTKILTLPF